ncbi:MAG TPA: dynamin family protein [Bacillota bacterium]|nr:dynamin family protein [Bacillota bacterium]
MNCNQCGKTMPNNLNYCSNCGKVINFPQSVEEQYQPEYEKRLKDFCAGLQAVNQISNEAQWDSTINKYILTVRKARKIAEKKEMKRYFTSGYFTSLDAFLQRCNKKEFHIALVGAIKAGKSTLINALFERELASTSVTPETASLTKFRSSKGKDYIKISFYSAAEWAELWKSVEDAKAKVFKEEYAELKAESEKAKWLGHADTYEEFENEAMLKESIKKWTSSKSATHYFVKEVEVGLKSLDIPEQIVYVDTPGLDDPVEFRSNITRNYIDRANVVLVCVRAAALTGPELQTIYRVFANTRYNPGKVYVIGTQIDALNDIADDWKQQRMEWLKHLSGINCYNNKELAEKNLIGTAAYLYTLLLNYRKGALSDKEKRTLSSIAVKLESRVDNPNDYQKMISQSNLIVLRNRINKELLADSNRLMLLDIKEKYKDCQKNIKETFIGLREGQIELIGVANGDVEEIRKKIDEQKKSLVEVQAEKTAFDELMSNFKEMASMKANDLFEAIKSLN